MAMRMALLITVTLGVAACGDDRAETDRALVEQMRHDALARAARSARRACESERLALANELAANVQHQANLRNELAVAERNVAAARAYDGGPNEVTIAIHENHVIEARGDLATTVAAHGVIAGRLAAKTEACAALAGGE